MKLIGYDRHGRQAWTMTRKEDLLMTASTFTLPEWWTWERPGTTVRIVAKFDDGSEHTYTNPAGGKS